MQLKTIFAAIILYTGFAFSASAENETAMFEDIPVHTVIHSEKLPPDYVLGQTDAPVTVIEYSSLSCPHCASFSNHAFPELREQYIKPGKVKFIHRDFPLNNPALRASMLAQCAGADKYYPFLKVLFGTQRKWVSPGFMESLAMTAKLGGMSQEAFDACMNNKELETKVLESRKYGSEKFKISSTPSFVINGKMHKGLQTIEQMQAILDPLLANNNDMSTPPADSRGMEAQEETPEEEDNTQPAE